MENINENKGINKAHIVVVDDEPLNLQLLEEVLSDEGFVNVVYFDSPIVALKYVESENVDLILLDIKMPLMDGFEFMDRLKESDKPRPPILVLTASADKDTKSKVLAADAQGVIGKPFDFDEVLERMEEIISR